MSRLRAVHRCAGLLRSPIPLLSVLAGVAATILPPVPANSSETIFRCTSPDGHVEYSNHPCDSGTRTTLQIKDERVGWEAPRVPPKSRSGAGAKRKPGKRSRHGEKARDKQEIQCWNKRKKVEKIQWRMRRGYRAGKGPELRRKRREHEEYLRHFCR